MTEKRPPKTIKERKWAKKTVELGNATDAAMQVYDVKDRNSAKAIASQNFSKLTLVPLMEEKGITDDKLLDVLDDGLAANKTVSARVITKKGDLAEANESTDDFIDVPDHDVRHKYLKTALELKGHLNDRGNTNVQVNLTTNNLNIDPQELEAFTTWRNEQRRKRLQKSTTGSPGSVDH